MGDAVAQHADARYRHRLSRHRAVRGDDGVGGPRHDAPATYLVPGERAVFKERQPVRKDRPQLEKVLAWQRREVAFDNFSLQDAIAEMNRYNRRSLEVDAAGSDHMNVTGLFRAGDSLSFARAVAEAYHLTVIEEPERIVLRK